MVTSNKNTRTLSRGIIISLSKTYTMKKDT